MRQPQAVLGPGHIDIGKDRANVASFLQYLGCNIRIAGFNDRITRLFQKRSSCQTNKRLILED
jgi:hypothetical protein